MLNVWEFKAAMARKGYTQKALAKVLGISEKTFADRIKHKCFGSDEIEKLVFVLEIRDPIPVFFSNIAAAQVTKTC